MNYLAHLYLSGESEKKLIGNFIGDDVKGNKYLKYDAEIAEGILLHRQIDSFTDNHPLHREARLFFRAEFGLYAGIVVDFMYDHFLAKNWGDYSSILLHQYTKYVHAVLLSHFLILPRRIQGFLPFLIQNKRLASYASVDGIVLALEVMGKHSSLPSKSAKAKTILLDNYIALEHNFTAFFAELIEYVTSVQNIKRKNTI
ncbi:MAG TPA: ACP phosphodiesterase [Draconibacterium sp.]|nr:ACP phosphodiesterase [Draconibacterium sp.]